MNSPSQRGGGGGGVNGFIGFLSHVVFYNSGLLPADVKHAAGRGERPATPKAEDEWHAMMKSNFVSDAELAKERRAAVQRARRRQRAALDAQMESRRSAAAKRRADDAQYDAWVKRDAAEHCQPADGPPPSRVPPGASSICQ